MVKIKYKFYASFAHYKLGKLKKAIYYSERVLLREPANIKNRIHLIKLLRLNEDFKNEKLYNSYGLQLDPNNLELKDLNALG